MEGTVIQEIFALRIIHVQNVRVKKFMVYNNLTHIQLHTTCVKNIFCLIFVVFDDYDNLLQMKISQFTVFSIQIGMIFIIIFFKNASYLLTKLVDCIPLLTESRRLWQNERLVQFISS